jgi:hypothetical protein
MSTNIDILEAQNIQQSSQDYCETLDDVVCSKTLERILEILSHKSDARFHETINNIPLKHRNYVLGDAGIPLDSPRISRIFHLIKHQKYITFFEQEHFLNFINLTTNQEEAKKIISKLYFQHTFENKDFLRETFEAPE